MPSRNGIPVCETTWCAWRAKSVRSCRNRSVSKRPSPVGMPRNALNFLWSALHDAVDWVLPEGAPGAQPIAVLSLEQLKIAEPWIFGVRYRSARARRALCGTEYLEGGAFQADLLSQFAGWCIEHGTRRRGARRDDSVQPDRLSWTLTTVRALGDTDPVPGAGGTSWRTCIAGARACSRNRVPTRANAPTRFVRDSSRRRRSSGARAARPWHMDCFCSMHPRFEGRGPACKHSRTRWRSSRAARQESDSRQPSASSTRSVGRPHGSHAGHARRRAGRVERAEAGAGCARRRREARRPRPALRGGEGALRRIDALFANRRRGALRAARGKWTRPSSTPSSTST